MILKMRVRAGTWRGNAFQEGLFQRGLIDDDVGVVRGLLA